MARIRFGTETWNAAFDVPSGARYVRAEVVDATGSLESVSLIPRHIVHRGVAEDRADVR